MARRWIDIRAPGNGEVACYYKPVLRQVSLIGSLLLLAIPCVAADGGYAGSATCARCHPAQYEKQIRSEHAQALRRAPEHPSYLDLPESLTSYRPPDYRLTWTRKEKGIDVVAFDGAAELRLPIEWAFGAGQQAVTFVSRVDEDSYLEHHLSWYATSKSLAHTPGHRSQRPAKLTEALGVVYRTFAADSAILSCFGCHSTGPLTLGPQMEIVPFEAGVRCEACHGSGSAHASRGDKAAIFNPAKLTSASMNTYCGDCHRPPASDPNRIDWSDAWNVRHQPVYLSRSRCFEESGGALRCTTCHDPHAPLERSTAAYSARCGACHSDVSHASVMGDARDCVRCHMPQVQPQPNLTFTNHWIGVFDHGSPLLPRAQRQRR